MSLELRDMESIKMESSVSSGLENVQNSEPSNSVVHSRRASKEVIYVGDAPNSGNQANLQANFKKFRDQKIKEHQMMKMVKQASFSSGRSQAFKDDLRARFIDAAKRYLGVPYAQRYKAPEDPVAPLYLDCCALVRQALLDLQDDFGFVIGRWNQCYQIDTLPIVLTQDQLKPGDLIFYEGEYVSNRSKPQKHNMVHVEIFLGGGETGEECIGSRYHRGKVSLFPSFRFTSTTWKLVNYHFRSIDTWLDGICKSCCPEHPWQSDALSYVEAAGKRSIFCEDCTAEDVSAGGEEDEESQEHEDGVTAPYDEASSIADAATTDGGGKESHPVVPSNSSAAPPTKRPPRATVDGSVGSIKKTNASTAGSSASGKVKRPSPYRSGSNNDIVESSKGGTHSKVMSATSNKEGTVGYGHSYYVGKSNGWKLVKESMDRRGWTQLPFDYQFSTRFALKWVERRSQIDYRAHVPGQLVCHIPNNDCICTKVGLLTTLRDHFCRVTASASSIVGTIPWLPETFDLDLPSDVHRLLKIEEAHQQLLQTQPLVVEAAATDSVMTSTNAAKANIWIYKPASSNRGRGIRVLSGLENLRTICMGKQTGDPETSIAPAKGIVQRYLTDPLLVHNHCKFDIRCYLMIARTHPKTLAFYHPGYCRLALKPYPTDYDSLLASLDDTMLHLTNASIQKKGADYAQQGDQQIQSIAALIHYLEENGQTAQAAYMRDGLDSDIKRCMVDILKASNHKLLKQHGYFDLLGCDFMVIANNQLVLLEINTNPALSLDNHVLEELLPGVVDGALELVLQTQGPDVELQENVDVESILRDKMPPKSQFQLIFNEATNGTFQE